MLPGVHPVIQFFGLAPGSFPFDGGTLLVNPLLVSVFNLPFGPLALDYAIPIESPDPLADKGGQFQFYLDYQF